MISLIGVTVLFLPNDKEVFNYYFVTLSCAFLFFFPESFLISERSPFLKIQSFSFCRKEQIHVQKTVLLFVGRDCPCSWGSAWKTAAISAQQGVGVSHGLNVSFQVGLGLHVGVWVCLTRQGTEDFVQVRRF